MIDIRHLSIDWGFWGAVVVGFFVGHMLILAIVSESRTASTQIGTSANANNISQQPVIATPTIFGGEGR